jgi:hypothetical protein
MYSTKKFNAASYCVKIYFHYFVLEHFQPFFYFLVRNSIAHPGKISGKMVLCIIAIPDSLQNFYISNALLPKTYLL